MWDDKLLSAFPKLTTVEQPLFHILNKNIQDKAKSIASGEMKMDSILNCYYRNGNRKNGNGHTEPSVRSSKVAYPY
jgi:hypothetical protein